MGYSLHAGQVTVADGSAEMGQRIERVLTNDPGIGVIRHADAGYETSRKIAGEQMNRTVEADSPHFYPRYLSHAEVNHGGKDMVYKKE